MSLVDEGRVSLEDRLDKYLPSFANTRVLPEGAKASMKQKEPIRMKHVISHTSGIAYPPDIGEDPEGEVSAAYVKLQKAAHNGTISSLKAFVERLAKIPLVCQPGETYEYGFSMDVLARVVEVIMGKDIEHCLKERVFQPLGMSSTSWHVSDDELHRLAACYAGPATWGNLYGHNDSEVPITSRRGMVRIDGNQAEHSGWRQGQHCRVKSGGGFISYISGGLVSSVADTVAFVQMLMNKGVTASGQRLLKERSLELMERNRLKASWDKGSACYIGNIGVFRDGGKEFGMGGAACTYWSMDRADDVACIWFTQHVDMPEFGDIEGVNTKRADLWQAMYDAVRTKAAKAAKKRAGAAAKKRDVVGSKRKVAAVGATSTAKRSRSFSSK